MYLLNSICAKRLIDVQKRIASRVILEDDYCEEAVAGVDQTFRGDMVISGSVVLCPSFKITCIAGCIMKAQFPYIAGFLSFREGPPAMKAVRALNPKPTLLFVDGCGINHPRMAGLASYVGVILDLPTIGISKNVLCGRFDAPEKVADAAPLIYEGKVVGYVLKSKKGCRPLVVAPGHRISADSTLDMTRFFLRGHKLPEPCRLAHEYARKFKMALFPEPKASSLASDPS